MTNVTLVPPMAVNPLSNGAVGDGTTDDSTALTNTLALLSTSTGGNLYIPYGYTFLTSGLNVSSFSGYLNIFGGGTLKLKNGANQYIIYSTSGSQTKTIIDNVRFDCNSANQTSASGGIHLYKARRCIIKNCEIFNPWQAGIFLEGASGDFGYQNRIHDNWIYGGSNTTTGTNAYGEGLRLIYTDENTVYANHFEANGNFNDSTYGCHIYDQNGLTAYTDNSFVNGYGVIKLDGLQCVIKGNRFDGNGRYSVQCNGSATQTIITNNIHLHVGYRATGGSNNTIDGIYLNATECIVSNNWFQAAGGSFPYTRSFVNIDTGATYSLVEHNMFDVQSTSGTVTAIYYPGAVPTGSRVRFNNGYDNSTSTQIWVTESHGSATITAGNTSIVVNHGLSVTPTIDQIYVTAQSNVNGRSMNITTVTSTQFTININNTSGSNIIISWAVNAGY